MPIQNLPNVVEARGAIGGLYSAGAPEPFRLGAARATLSTSMLDREIRERTSRSGVRLNDAQVGHLVGLLLGESGVPSHEVGKIEELVRLVVARANGVRL